jgi:hypothetical protein
MYEPNAGFVVNPWTKSTGFKMLIHPATAEHIDAQVKQPIWERVEEYSNKLNISPGSKNLFLYQGGYFYVYYDRKGRKLCIVKFT